MNSLPVYCIVDFETLWPDVEPRILPGEKMLATRPLTSDTPATIDMAA